MSSKYEYGAYIDHHKITKEAYTNALRLWEEGKANINCPRCHKCWLRTYECYCHNVTSRSDATMNNVRITMYYHYQELGRSANTAHVLSMLMPDKCEDLIFGDIVGEKKLVDSIKREQDSGNLETCILYPLNDCPTIAEWKASRKNPNGPLRIVAIDGTYSHAVRQVKHLQHLLGETYLPVVRLQLEGHTRSAVAGIMRQPTGEKICTMQAIVMALQQAGASHELCDTLHSDLMQWIDYIVRRKVKC